MLIFASEFSTEHLLSSPFLLHLFSATPLHSSLLPLIPPISTTLHELFSVLPLLNSLPIFPRKHPCMPAFPFRFHRPSHSLLLTLQSLSVSFANRASNERFLRLLCPCSQNRQNRLKTAQNAPRRPAHPLTRAPIPCSTVINSLNHSWQTKMSHPESGSLFPDNTLKKASQTARQF